MIFFTDHHHFNAFYELFLLVLAILVDRIDDDCILVLAQHCDGLHAHLLFVHVLFKYMLTMQA